MKILEVAVGQKEKIIWDQDQDAAITIGKGSLVSGIIKCPENTVEITVTGGTVELFGECKHLIIRKATAGSLLNLSSLFCQEATIDLADWGSCLEIAVSRIIHSVCLRKASLLRLSGSPQILNISLHGGSAIEQNDND